MGVQVLGAEKVAVPVPVPAPVLAAVPKLAILAPPKEVPVLVAAAPKEAEAALVLRLAAQKVTVEIQVQVQVRAQVRAQVPAADRKAAAEAPVLAANPLQGKLSSIIIIIVS